ncbi:FAD-dependent oxidoreductase [Corynebacterium diphtheriae bv. gravis]|uniref:FAD-dependent oxidoreductase n=1 Tax=Corynebacterium diphtheriae TaxID=1717 RepID=UPI0008937506|nr:FAD-dependent oxidoreductase [Corynebacterium diphtheriae]MBG9247633.1 FAD-dependent oxidoreductase [Corynebacterium diphtheriae bv. gravis]MBG9295950.1 FAD-dependent oxidoreductase [Corynebacterium diphtheriae bv. gravis]OFI52996.1 CoA-disulfide reductase [Corynebacterium diphtheriae]OFI62800.1 CoA-disulfide reductase [Corynebacterium diphtheriae]OSQ19577.1 CoA-disulfide reductase [Corynebacterium diphtheriae]
MTTTIIVGGVAGGMSTAARLRRRDEDMTILVFEASNHVSFANCGLPYHVSGVIPERSSLLLQTPESLAARFNIDVRVDHLVTAINREAGSVSVKNLVTGEVSDHHYDHLVLSPGARPILPPLPGIEKALTLRTVEDVDTIIERVAGASSAAIIGGGFIGIELAENLAHRGIATTIIERGPQILGPLDSEMAAFVEQRLRDNGIIVRTNANAAAITDTGVELADGSAAAEIVVAAVGVAPASGLARAAGLAVGERGGIVVDDQLRTNDPQIFALGDAAEKRDAISGADTLVPLAQTANRHGRLVADIITGRDVKRTSTLGTAIVGVFGLAAASVGWSEKRAVAAGKNIRVIHTHPASHAGYYYPGAAQLHLKLVVDADTDAILGAQAVGEDGADKRIDVIATAMRAGLSATDLADLELAYSPQYGSAKDPVNLIGMVNDNIRSGERSVQWHELDAQIADGWTLVDVRTAGEFAAGNIPGAINIPVDELREHLDELQGKNVLVHCQVGLRGHVAATLLTNSGINAANLDGGYLTWKTATS